MTESEWLSCTDPTPMLNFLRGKVSDRKLRFFVCACCRRHWSMFWAANRQALDATEAFADGRIGQDELEKRTKSWRADYPSTVEGTWQRAIVWAMTTHRRFWAVAAAENVSRVSDEPLREKRAQAALLRDLFGNPFVPARMDPAWLAWNDGTVVKLAAGLYDERAFDRLPILADALLDAGCQDAAILNHCRQGGPHVLGCHVVDLLTGRS
jgi:hypothetical protein